MIFEELSLEKFSILVIPKILNKYFEYLRIIINIDVFGKQLKQIKLLAIVK